MMMMTAGVLSLWLLVTVPLVCFLRLLFPSFLYISSSFIQCDPNHFFSLSHCVDIFFFLSFFLSFSLFFFSLFFSFLLLSGKTCLLIAFATGEFPTEYVPTVFENYSAKMKINDKAVFLHLWDTAGQEDYDRLRPLSYPDSDIVLLCFSTTSKNSYDSVQEKWNPEIKHYLPNTPVILVGTKVDLRDAKLEDKNAEKTEYVSHSEGVQLQNEIGALRYMEVSAKTACEEGGGGLQDIFLECVKTVLTDLEDDAGGDDADAAATGSRPAKQAPRRGACLLL